MRDRLRGRASAAARRRRDASPTPPSAGAASLAPALAAGADAGAGETHGPVDLVVRDQADRPLLVDREALLDRRCVARRRRPARARLLPRSASAPGTPPRDGAPSCCGRGRCAAAPLSEPACWLTSWPKNSSCAASGQSTSFMPRVSSAISAGRLGDEVLALLERALGLDARHQLGAGAAQAHRIRRLGAVAPRRGDDRLAQTPQRKSRTKVGSASGSSASRRRWLKRCCDAPLELLAAQRRRRRAGRGPRRGSARRRSARARTAWRRRAASWSKSPSTISLTSSPTRSSSSFAGPLSKLSKAQASDATRLMKRRTGWRRDEKKLLSASAARSTGSCSRAIWRAISGGTRASERIWSNRLLTTSITRWSSLPREACSSSARWARIRLAAIRPDSPVDGGWTYELLPSGTPGRVVSREVLGLVAGVRAVAGVARQAVELAEVAGAAVEAAQQAHQLGVGLGHRRRARPARSADRSRHAAADQAIEQRGRALGIDRIGRIDIVEAADDRVLPAARRRPGLRTHAAVHDCSQALRASSKPVPAARSARRRARRALVDRAHRQVGRPHRAPLQVGDDLAVARRHPVRHRLAELAREDLLRVGLLGDLLDRLVQRQAEHRAAQGIRRRIGPAVAQQPAHVAVELAQLGLAAMPDQLADPLERDLLLDLAFVDEADRLPVGRLAAPAWRRSWRRCPR